VRLDKQLKLEFTEKYVLKSTDLMLKIKNFMGRGKAPPETLPTGMGLTPSQTPPPRGHRPLDRRYPNYDESKKILKLCPKVMPCIG